MSGGCPALRSISSYEISGEQADQIIRTRWIGYSDFEEQPSKTPSPGIFHWEHHWSCSAIFVALTTDCRGCHASHVRPELFSSVGHLCEWPTARTDLIFYKCAQRLSDRPHRHRVQTSSVHA